MTVACAGALSNSVLHLSEAGGATIDDIPRKTFSNERAKLEGQLNQTDKASTENLRVALRRYRSFFERLLSL